MDLLHSIIFGIVEGITEFLPISSTAHLMLTGKLLGLEQTEFLKSFEIAIQLGAIASVVVLYRKTAFLNIAVLKRIFAAFIPTAVFGFIFYSIVKEFLLGSNVVALSALFLGGIVLIVFELLHREEESAVRDVSQISYKAAFTIGVFQAAAIVPGVSRAAATIVGGLLLGIGRKTIVEFSFLLAVPTMLAATAFDFIKTPEIFSMQQLWFLIVGSVVSFFVATLSIKFLLRFIDSHTFISFGVYRIVMAVAFWLLIL